MKNRNALLIFLLSPVIALAGQFNLEMAAPGIYVHHGEHKEVDVGYGGDICNIGFIVGKKGVAVIDTSGSPKIAAKLREEIKKVTPLPILYVINTHVHPDHLLGNAAFIEDHPVFVGHKNLAIELNQRKDAYLSAQPQWVGEEDAANTKVIPPTLEVGNSQEIDLGDRKLKLTAYSTAHTETDLTIFDQKTSTIWTGDLLFIERTPTYESNVKNWLNVIKQLRNIQALHVVPGHGPVSTDWHKALDNESRYWTSLINDVRSEIKKGRSMEQAIDESNQSEKGKWVLFDAINRRNIARIYPELEWE